MEYNPLYLVSAMLVLSGTILWSRGLATQGGMSGELGVAAVAELYSVALIAGAALLMRLEQRRSAVMLALLTVLYQCDLTLHTETCPNLGWVGMLATAGWVALFRAKLTALAWAMKLRLSRATFATASLGGVGLALLPYALSSLESRASSAFVAMWLFALFACHSFVDVTATPENVALDGWGHTVLRRSVRATWLVWGLLLSLHLLFWSSQYRLESTMLWPVVPLVSTRFIRSEARVWSVVVATLLFIGLGVPSAFSVSALLAAAALGLRAWIVAHAPDLSSAASEPSEPPEAFGPYRHFDAGSSMGVRILPAIAPSFVAPTGRGAVHRLACGALLAAYLSVWTVGWGGGSWPAHVLALDIVTALVFVLGAMLFRARVGLLPPMLGVIELLFASHLVPTPRSLSEWGGAAIGLGFLLLLVSIAASYALHRTGKDPRSSGVAHVRH